MAESKGIENALAAILANMKTMEAKMEANMQKTVQESQAGIQKLSAEAEKRNKVLHDENKKNIRGGAGTIRAE